MEDWKMLPRTLLLFVLLTSGLCNTYSVAEIPDGVNPGSGIASNIARLQPTFSPRQFCRSRGGVVNETDQADIYLCCYVKKQKCIVTDTRQTISWPIPYAERDRVRRGYMFTAENY